MSEIWASTMRTLSMTRVSVPCATRRAVAPAPTVNRGPREGDPPAPAVATEKLTCFAEPPGLVVPSVEQAIAATATSVTAVVQTDRAVVVIEFPRAVRGNT